MGKTLAAFVILWALRLLTPLVGVVLTIAYAWMILPDELG
jgi:hypothetical protein